MIMNTPEYQQNMKKVEWNEMTKLTKSNMFDIFQFEMEKGQASKLPQLPIEISYLQQHDLQQKQAKMQKVEEPREQEIQ